MNTLINAFELLKSRKQNEYTKRATDFYRYLLENNTENIYYESITKQNHILADLKNRYGEKTFFISFLLTRDYKLLNNDSTDHNLIITEFIKLIKPKNKATFINQIKYYDMAYLNDKIIIDNDKYILRLKPYCILPTYNYKDITAGLFIDNNNIDLMTRTSYNIIYQYRIVKKLNKKNKTQRKKRQEKIIINIEKSDEIDEVIINDNILKNKINCCCGSCILKSSYKKHILSNKHLIYLKNIDTNSDTNSDSGSDNESNIENILEDEQPINILEDEQPINILEDEQPINILEDEQPINILEDEQPINILEDEQPINILEDKPAFKAIEIQKNLKFPVVEINNCLSSLIKKIEQPLNIAFDKNIYFNDKNKIIDMITNLYNTNNNFKALFNSFNLLKIIKNFHKDMFLGMHFNAIFLKNNDKSKQMHFYITNNEITTITEVNFLI
jgi:hypothetical protein